MRGPGDLFGIRQSGVMEFKIADIYQDAELLGKISRTVDNLLAEDWGIDAKFIDFRTI